MFGASSRHPAARKRSSIPCCNRGPRAPPAQHPVLACRADFVIELALKKTSYPFAVAFVKAILCNWLVCLVRAYRCIQDDHANCASGRGLPSSCRA